MLMSSMGNSGGVSGSGSSVASWLNSDKRIEQTEIQKYWEIFSSLAKGATYLTGVQAAQVLKNSNLQDHQLEKVWDLADVDNDGNLDFEEFCVAMRLIFDLVNGELVELPKVLPDWIVPQSKAHLVQANRAIFEQQNRFNTVDNFDFRTNDHSSSQKNDEFDSYISPSNRSKYEAIYEANRDHRGLIRLHSLDSLISSLDISNSDVRAAWNMVNQNHSDAIGMDACIIFLHILNHVQAGLPMPRNLPEKLRNSLENSSIDNSMDRHTNHREPSRLTPTSRGNEPEEDTVMARKAKFGDAYLSRLESNNHKKNQSWRELNSSPNDLSSKTSEEDDVRREIQVLESKIRAAESEKEKSKVESAHVSKVRRELEQLLEYKKRQMRVLDQSEKIQMNNIQTVKDDISAIKEQILGLETHLKNRQEALADLKRSIELEKSRT